MRVWVPCVNDEHLVMGAGHVTKRWVGALIPEMFVHFNRKKTKKRLKRQSPRATASKQPMQSTLIGSVKFFLDNTE